ncbi:MAG: hypothetical protein JO254_17185 [Pseudolabrys sp.]|nr:hypothetical protein [Pseudolabrys sp.]
MVAVTYGVARAAAGALKSKAKSKKADGLFARFVAAFTEARVRQAERELALHGFVRNKNDDVPFVRGW